MADARLAAFLTFSDLSGIGSASSSSSSSETGCGSGGGGDFLGVDFGFGAEAGGGADLVLGAGAGGGADLALGAGAGGGADLALGAGAGAGAAVDMMFIKGVKIVSYLRTFALTIWLLYELFVQVTHRRCFSPFGKRTSRRLFFLRSYHSTATKRQKHSLVHVK